MTNLGFRNLSLNARLVYLFLCQEKRALIRIWPEHIAREINLDFSAVYQALDELCDNQLLFYERDFPLCWLPDQPFDYEWRHMPKCQLLSKALEHYGIRQAARESLPAYFSISESGGKSAGERFKVKLEEARKKASQELEVKLELEERDSEPPLILNNFNLTNARAEEDFNLNNTLNISSSSPKNEDFLPNSSSSSLSSSTIPAPDPEPETAHKPAPKPEEQTENTGEHYETVEQYGNVLEQQDPFDLKAGREGMDLCQIEEPCRIRGNYQENALERKQEENLVKLLNFEPYTREGKVFYFLNCQGETEAISHESVKLWEQAFPSLDMALELAGISVWLSGHHADLVKGGPLPGRANMENYIANCLRSAARKLSEQAQGIKRKNSRRPKANKALVKKLDALIDKCLEGSRCVNMGG